VDWEALAKGAPVIVVYMALKHIAMIAERLIAAAAAAMSRRGRQPRDDAAAARARDDPGAPLPPRGERH